MGTHNRPWCSRHNMHPARCFDLHSSPSSKKALTEEQHRMYILARHLRKQEENIRKQAEKLSRTADDLRELHKKYPEG